MDRKSSVSFVMIPRELIVFYDDLDLSIFSPFPFRTVRCDRVANPEARCMDTVSINAMID